MVPREKMYAALAKDGVPNDHCFPAVLIYETLVYRDHYESMTRSPWWHSHHHELDKQLKYMLERATTYEHDWLDINQFDYYDYDDEERSQIRVGISGNQVVRKNLVTGISEVINPPVISGEHIATKEVNVVDEKHLDSLIPTRASICKYQKAKSNNLQKEVLDALPDLFRVVTVNSPIWSLANVIGHTNYLIESVMRPNLIKHACRRLLGNAISDIEHAASLGADGIFIEECLADMLSPASYDELVVPILTELNDVIRSLGLKSIMYYTGNPKGKLDLLVKTRPDAFAFEEGKKDFSNDIIQIAEYFQGNFTILGNVDSIGTIQDGDYSDLKVEMKRQLQAARINKNRFIFSQGSPITPSTPNERIRDFTYLAHNIAEV